MVGRNGGVVSAAVSGFGGVPQSLNAIWIACHFQRKLGKKDIQDADIQAAVQIITNYSRNPTVSLRVSGGLLLGIAHIYWRKIDCFWTRCQGVLERIRLSQDSQTELQQRDARSKAKGARQMLSDRMADECDETGTQPDYLHSLDGSCEGIPVASVSATSSAPLAPGLPSPAPSAQSMLLDSAQMFDSSVDEEEREDADLCRRLLERLDSLSTAPLPLPPPPLERPTPPARRRLRSGPGLADLFGLASTSAMPALPPVAEEERSSSREPLTTDSAAGAADVSGAASNGAAAAAVPSPQAAAQDAVEKWFRLGANDDGDEDALLAGLGIGVAPATASGVSPGAATPAGASVTSGDAADYTPEVDMVLREEQPATELSPGQLVHMLTAAVARPPSVEGLAGGGGNGEDFMGESYRGGGSAASTADLNSSAARSLLGGGQDASPRFGDLDDDTALLLLPPATPSHHSQAADPLRLSLLSLPPEEEEDGRASTKEREDELQRKAQNSLVLSAAEQLAWQTDTRGLQRLPRQLGYFIVHLAFCGASPPLARWTDTDAEARATQIYQESLQAQRRPASARSRSRKRPRESNEKSPEDLSLSAVEAEWPLNCDPASQRFVAGSALFGRLAAAGRHHLEAHAKRVAAAELRWAAVAEAAVESSSVAMARRRRNGRRREKTVAAPSEKSASPASPVTLRLLPAAAAAAGGLPGEEDALALAVPVEFPGANPDFASSAPPAASASSLAGGEGLLVGCAGCVSGASPAHSATGGENGSAFPPSVAPSFVSNDGGASSLDDWRLPPSALGASDGDASALPATPLPPSSTAAAAAARRRTGGMDPDAWEVFSLVRGTGALSEQRQQTLPPTPFRTPVVRQQQQLQRRQQQMAAGSAPPCASALEVRDATPIRPPGVGLSSAGRLSRREVLPLSRLIHRHEAGAWQILRKETDFSFRTVKVMECLSARLSRETAPCLSTATFSKRGGDQRPRTASTAAGEDEEAANDGDDVAVPVVSLQSLLRSQPRDVAATVFFELLTLRSRRFVDFAVVGDTQSSVLRADGGADLLIAADCRYEQLATALAALSPME